MAAIPRQIHYCWFGGKPLGQKELSCIESWRRFLPDYEIVRWDETNFDVRCCAYASEAYDVGKWAFASDYARFKILFENGGLYFDTDVELIASIEDIISKGPYMGFETDCALSSNKTAVKSGYLPTVNPGVGLSAVPGMSLYREILASYEEDHFVGADGSHNQTTIVHRVTGILRNHGLRDTSGLQEVAGITIYPSEYFSPKDFYTGVVTVTDNTRSIHHFAMSWFTEEEKHQYGIRSTLLRKGISFKTANIVSGLITAMKFHDFERLTKRFK